MFLWKGSGTRQAKAAHQQPHGRGTKLHDPCSTTHCNRQSRSIGDFCCISSASAHLNGMADSELLKPASHPMWLKISFYFPDSKIKLLVKRATFISFLHAFYRLNSTSRKPKHCHLQLARLEQRAEMGRGSALQANSRFSATSVSSHHHALVLRCKA